MSSGTAYFDTELARTRAQDQCEQVSQRLLSSVAGVRAREGHGALPTSLLDRRPLLDADRATFLDWSAAATAQAVELEARINAHDAIRSGRGLDDQFRALAASGPVAAPGRGAGPVEHSSLVPPFEEQPTAEQLTGQVAAVLASVNVSATDAEREELTRIASQVLATPHRTQRTLLTELRARVQQVDKDASERRGQRARAQVLFGSLEGLEGSAVADELTFLGEVARGGAVLTSADVLRIEQVREQALAEQERRFVADRLAQALSGLGYRVGDGFLADVRAGRAGFALLDASEEHAVRVEIAKGSLDYGLVRTVEGDDADRDQALEGALCGHMGRFIASVRPDGVAFRFREHRDPGSRPLEVSRDAAEVASRQKGATKPRLRERER